MREIELTPYGGTLFYTNSRSKFRKQRKRLTGESGKKIMSAGLTHWITDGNHQVWLVYADETPTLAHELTHVVLFLFKHVGIDPFEANVDVCYLEVPKEYSNDIYRPEKIDEGCYLTEVDFDRLDGQLHINHAKTQTTVHLCGNSSAFTRKCRVIVTTNSTTL